MLKQSKLFSAAVVLSVAFAMAASPALAEFGSINSGTGFDSVNTILGQIENDFNAINNNAEDIDNVAPVSSETGLNEADFNVGPTQLLSGNAILGGGFDNSAININSAAYLDSFLGGFAAVNESTGAESVNAAAFELDSDVDLANFNCADIDNEALIDVLTGLNSASFNTGPVGLGTGDAGAEVILANVANANYSEIALAATGGLLASNSCTGFDSLNAASAFLDSDIELVNYNAADIDNDVFVAANTGENFADFNGFGQVGLITGDAVMEVGLANSVNNNQNAIAVNFGGGIIQAGNSGTGAESANFANALFSNDIAIANFNAADIDNDVNLAANTGCNEADFNNGPVGLVTGGAGMDVQIVNGPINQNYTEIVAGSPVAVSAVNSLTGFGSVNSAAAAVINNTEVANQNVADVDNHVNVAANTGGNEADFNVGGCEGGCGTIGGAAAISTGNAVTNVAISNQVNTNTTAIAVAPVAGIVTGNQGTGAFSTNVASVAVVNNVDVVNNNYADIDNCVNVTSNTGNNSSSFNTGASAVSTGGAAVTFGAVNSANNNTTAVGGGF